MSHGLNRRAFLGWLAAAPALPAPKRPNFLVLLSDDQGYGDASCYGGDIPTPHIDSIARAGVRFERFYVAGPVCTPSRYGLLTGRYPARSRDRLLGALMPPSRTGIHPGEPTVAETLHGAGYRTALIGKWHLGAARPDFFPEHHGFDYWEGFTHGCIDYFDFTYGGMPSWYRNSKPYTPPRGYTTDYLTDQAIQWLDHNRANPFFLYLAYNAPHYGKGSYDPATGKARDLLQAPEEYIRRFAHIRDEKRRVYTACMSSLDDNIGRLLAWLDRTGLAATTFLVFLSDNGADVDWGGNNGQLRGEKAELFEGGIRVPAAMRWPGHIRPGRVLRQFAGSVDFYPTFCALAGLPAPAGVDGRDLRPAIFEDQTFDRELFWRTDQAEAYLRGNWKYIRTKAGEEFLFDLETDPREARNRVADPAAPGTAVKTAWQKLRASMPAS